MNSYYSVRFSLTLSLSWAKKFPCTDFILSFLYWITTINKECRRRKERKRSCKSTQLLFLVHHDIICQEQNLALFCSFIANLIIKVFFPPPLAFIPILIMFWILAHLRIFLEVQIFPFSLPLTKCPFIFFLHIYF